MYKDSAQELLGIRCGKSLPRLFHIDHGSFGSDLESSSLAAQDQRYVPRIFLLHSRAHALLLKSGIQSSILSSILAQDESV